MCSVTCGDAVIGRLVYAVCVCVLVCVCVWVVFYFRFSGSDISVAVRDVLMEPIRKCQDAKFFRVVSVIRSLVIVIVSV